MVSCAKLVLETVIASGSNPMTRRVVSLAKGSCESWPIGQPSKANFFSHQKVRDPKSESVVKTGMKLEPFCLNPRLTM